MFALSISISLTICCNFAHFVMSVEDVNETVLMPLMFLRPSGCPLKPEPSKNAASTRRRITSARSRRTNSSAAAGVLRMSVFEMRVAAPALCGFIDNISTA